MNKKITELVELAGGSVSGSDIIPVVDVSTGTTKKVLINSVGSALADAGVLSLFATSATSNSIGTGVKSWTTEAPRSFLVALPYVLVSSSSDENKWMYGKVTSYDYATNALTGNVIRRSGAGTLTSWKIAVSGPPLDIIPSATKLWQIVIDDSGVIDTQEVT